MPGDRPDEPTIATNHFREYLKTAAPSKERADAERELQDQTKLVTLVEVQAPEGAGLFLDGEQVGLSPLADSLVVAPGPHTVTARVGDAKQEKAFTGSRGETLKLSFVFEKASPAPAPSASSAPPPSATAPVPTYPPPTVNRSRWAPIPDGSSRRAPSPTWWSPATG